MKLNVDLSLHFWIGLAIFVSSGISGGMIHLTNAIPADWIPAVTAWSSIISIIGSGYLTAALGLHNASPEAKVKAVDALAKDPTSPIVGVVTANTPEGKAIANSIPGNTTVVANSPGANSVAQDSVPPLQSKL